MHWILDNGHGIDTKGKRSPDGKLLEYKFSRNIVKHLRDLLKNNNHIYHILVTEIEDVPLSERVNRINRYQKEHGDCILISIHGNAYGNGKEWTKPSGIETWCINQYAPSATFAKMFQENLFETLNPGKRYKDIWRNRGVKYCSPTKPFYILKNSNCPAILTENGFYTNQKECESMLLEVTQRIIAVAHYKSIVKIERSYEKISGSIV